MGVCQKNIGPNVKGLALAKLSNLSITILKTVMIYKPLKKQELMSPY